MPGSSPIGAKLRRYRAAFFSLPPCGGGSGWGVVTRGNTVPHLPTPTPDPSPQGGGEKRTAVSHLNLTPMGQPPALPRKLLILQPMRNDRIRPKPPHLVGLVVLEVAFEP